MSTLMIVESPKKAKEIGKYLGPDFVVLASYGHVRDLPSKGQGDGDLVTGVGRDFAAQYVVGERSGPTVAKLKEAAKKAQRVVLATDPDREGEAIAWHLQVVLGLRAPDRVTYTEVTEKAVRAALAKPRAVNMDLVHAQEARRVLDRLVGYAVSPVLSRQAGQPLSAGRVQSPALRLVVERERQIRAFAQRLHFGAELAFARGWAAQWAIKPHLQPGEELWMDGDAAGRVAAVRQVLVLDYGDGTKSETPAPPFTTSTMQQEGAKRLGLGVKDVMAAAQGLFDSGHITYHRTDSPNFSEDSQAVIRAFAQAAGLPVAEKPRSWKAKAGAQEGHEATRPTKMDAEEAGETANERALYKLIRARSLASQLADAVYATRRAQLQAVAAEPVNGVVPSFEAKGRVLMVQGWRVVYAGDAKDEGDDSGEDEAELSNPIPVLEVGAHLTAESGRRLDKKTTPAKRFTEAGLVKELEARGIGRPSTYASIIGNITDRSYVAHDGTKAKYLVPTKTGEAIVDALVGKCRFADYEFTAGIEEELDQVAEGKRPYAVVVGASWRQLEGELAGLRMAAAEPEHPCPDCGKGLRRLKGANGFFWGCKGYPECKTSLPDAKGKPGKRAAVSSEHHCTQDGCGKPLIYRVKKGKGAFDFWGCSGFPTCKASYKSGADGKPVLGN